MKRRPNRHLAISECQQMITRTSNLQERKHSHESRIFRGSTSCLLCRRRAYRLEDLEGGEAHKRGLLPGKSWCRPHCVNAYAGCNDSKFAVLLGDRGFALLRRAPVSVRPCAVAAVHC